MGNKILSVKEIASKGGYNRAKNLTPYQRQEISRKGGSNKGKKGLSTASHVGVLQIGDVSITCAVVNGKRYISKTALDKSFGKRERGKTPKVVREIIEKRGGPPAFPVFLKYENLMNLITSELWDKIGTPLTFLWKGTKTKTIGYDADLLPDLCNLLIDANDLGVLSETQKDMAKKARIIGKGLMKVGILALVDEVTGFQEFRERDELTKILNKYIAKELQPWTKKFHPEFFKEIYKIYGWNWGEWSNHPQCVGNFINKFVYGELPPGVMEDLQNKNPSDEEGKRDHLHHQFLTNIGNEHLGKHLAIVTTLLRMSRNKGEFAHMFEKAFPGNQILMDI